MNHLDLPFLTPDLPGIGGVLKHMPEDFVVEEIPAYEPSGAGEHLFLWVEKRDVSADEFQRHLASALEIGRSEIGMAGLKDRRAVTRQYVSVPASCESKLPAVETDQIRVLRSARHTNKLKTGHLKSNQFSILIRDVPADAAERCERIALEVLRTGFPNYYGEQRFGRDGGTLETGLKLLRGEIKSRDLPKSRRRFLLRLSLSAVQSELFNQALAKRILENQIAQVFAGDVMQVTASGGLFVSMDPEIDQTRFDQGEITITGPIFGPKMRKAEGRPGQTEERILESAGLDEGHFRQFSKLTPGTRRPYLVQPGEFQVREEPDGVRMDFTLPSGAYATTLLREFQKPMPTPAGAVAARCDRADSDRGRSPGPRGTGD